ncbi:VOC family protein [Haloferax larsenii]|uniref:Glyoxalase/Bleomycin resistance protein/Dioxygenase superfamily protein n=1 Tax=Haloferax larsenii TaxID=302484 RepID=A0A1H7TG99_HALLR|nr:VOC family protein [Haloferax larsenii]SEL83733.1 Glyoxalase/Bleomycin resistance protein/Dioxygenase superfamily protein [Haloferax larsenii]
MTDSSAPEIPDRPDSPGAARALGEFALRVEDFETMREFYRDVVGLGEPIGDFGFATFFSLGESHAGHEAVFALFDRTDEAGYEGLDQTFTTLDHLAFSISPEDFDAEVERLRGHDLDLDFAYHEWVEWRSLYFADPEGNRVELVCRDPEGAGKNEQYETNE